MLGMDTTAVKSRKPDYFGFLSSLLSRILQSGLRLRKDTWLLGPVRSLEIQATCGRYGFEPEVRCQRFNMSGLQKTYSNSFVIHDGKDRSFSMYGGQEDEKFMLPKFYNEQGD
ncbi:unnamed protein product [Brassica napus]|uniref:Uncharacterized protein n=2 Tax=Brassica TaxID=3705 RepID=A0A3P6E6T9_BRAOL|nr:unnamed protein product [Brassica napus]VDD30025.1 unnamed protein product [Brassica oleracea]